MLNLLRFRNWGGSQGAQICLVLKTFHPQKQAAHSSYSLRQGADNTGAVAPGEQKDPQDTLFCLKVPGLLVAAKVGSHTLCFA